MSEETEIRDYRRLVRSIEERLSNDADFQERTIKKALGRLSDRRAKPRPKSSAKAQVSCPVKGCKNVGVKKFGKFCAEHNKLSAKEKAKYKRANGA